MKTDLAPGSVYWITGLSGAGKTTLCQELSRYLRTRGRPVIVLDGDNLRDVLGATQAHTRAERLDLALRYARLCVLIASQGVDVTIATISLFREVHDWNRIHMPGYVEIYLDVPLAELRRRDPKRIYERAGLGEITNVAGVDIEVDEPEAPNVHIKWRPGLTVETSLAQIVAIIGSEKFV